MTTRFAHTNIIAADYQALAAFYVTVFDCEPVPPAREIAEPWLARGTGVPDAALVGVHLRLPGHGPRGPTLEIFQYREALARPSPVAAHRPGFGHIAFEVEDVDAKLAQVVTHGGTILGDIVSAEVQGAGLITFVYATDPEGNIVELQRWAR